MYFFLCVCLLYFFASFCSNYFLSLLSLFFSCIFLCPLFFSHLIYASLSSSIILSISSFHHQLFLFVGVCMISKPFIHLASNNVVCKLRQTLQEINNIIRNNYSLLKIFKCISLFSLFIVFYYIFLYVENISYLGGSTSRGFVRCKWQKNVKKLWQCYFTRKYYQRLYYRSEHRKRLHLYFI